MRPGRQGPFDTFPRGSADRVVQLVSVKCLRDWQAQRVYDVDSDALKAPRRRR